MTDYPGRCRDGLPGPGTPTLVHLPGYTLPSLYHLVLPSDVTVPPGAAIGRHWTTWAPLPALRTTWAPLPAKRRNPGYSDPQRGGIQR